MIDAIGRTRETLSTAHRLSVRARATASGYRAAAILLAALMAAFAFDLFFPVDAPFRALFLILLVGLTVRTALSLRTQRSAEQVRLERAARLLEDRHPELDNALINAVQFSSELSARPDAPAAPLMRREIQRAERAAEVLPVQEPADAAAISRARRSLLVALAVLAVSAVLFPRAYRFELPRFFHFWGDHPRFTLTDFLVTPGNAHVKAGGSLNIQVKFGGLAPDRVSLVTSTRSGREQSTPLYASDGAYTQTLENLAADTTYYLQANTGRSARYTISVDHAPEVRSVHVHIQPPAYTKQPAAESALSEEGISALNGSVVGIEVEASRPLEGGELRLTYDGAPAETAALKTVPGKPGRASATFTMRRSGDFRIGLAATDGLTKPDAARGKLTLLRDEKPIVSLTVPGQNAMVTPDMEVPVRAEAEDDVGLQRIELHRIINDMADNAQTLATPNGQRKAEATTKLNFADLGVRPGDVIQYYATAYDVDPGRPNLADSDRNWLWVVSKEDYRKMLAKQRGAPQVVQEYRALTDALKTLAEQQQALAARMADHEKKSAAKPGDPALAQEKQALQKQQGELAARARELAESMKKLSAQPPQFDVEKSLQKKLGELAKQTGQAAEAMRQAQQSPNAGQMAQKSADAAKQLNKASGTGQKSIEKALEAVEKVAPLYQDLAHLKQLTKEQADLAMQARDMARQVKEDSFNRSRLNELSEKQARNRQGLKECRQNLGDHAGQCESVAPAAARTARQLSEAIEKMGIPEKMEDAESAFRKPDSAQGAGRAEEAQRALESLFQENKGGQGQCKSGLDQQLGLSLGEGSGQTLEQMAKQGLGQGQNPGMSSGTGQGVAQGEGGTPAPSPGSRPGDGSQQAGGQQPRPLSLALQQQQQSGASRKRENRPHFPAAELPGALGQRDVERLTNTDRKPSDARDASSGRYPAEYRRLVKDYFKAVSGGR